MPILTSLVIIYTMVLFNVYNIKVYVLRIMKYNSFCHNKSISRWSDDYYQLYYYASHNRLPAWFIGLIFGVFLLDYQENKNKFQLQNKVYNQIITYHHFIIFKFLISASGNTFMDNCNRFSNIYDFNTKQS